jgi:uncharacterized protein
VSNLTIRERFTLDARPERVWEYLVDPTRMVGCLPGAELTGQEDERTYSGAVKVKLGSLTISYRGKVVFEEVDEERRFIRIVGKGREKSGSGTATITMESRVTAAEGGGAEVTVNADVRLTGKVVRFGRGMIQSVSAEIFSTFTEELASMIAEETDRAPEGSASDSISLLPLMFRAVRRWLAALFGRR